MFYNFYIVTCTSVLAKEVKYKITVISTSLFEISRHYIKSLPGNKNCLNNKNE